MPIAQNDRVGRKGLVRGSPLRLRVEAKASEPGRNHLVADEGLLPQLPSIAPPGGGLPPQLRLLGEGVAAAGTHYLKTPISAASRAAAPGLAPELIPSSAWAGMKRPKCGWCELLLFRGSALDSGCLRYWIPEGAPALSAAAGVWTFVSFRPQRR